MPSTLQSPELQAFASGFPNALLNAGVALLILLAGAAIYALLTPHREITLIREGNAAAAISLGGVLVGLAIPVAVSLAHSSSLGEMGLWGAASLAVQLLVFRIVDMILHGLPQRIQEGEVAAAAVLVGAKLAVAIILAAAWTG
jgi:putative membrane protein